MSMIAPPSSTRHGFLKKLWYLTAPYFYSSEWKIAWIFLIAAIALSLGRVYILVLINDWNRDFFNALEQKDMSVNAVALFEHVFFETNRFSYLLLKFLFLALVFIVIAVYEVYLGQILQLRWRRFMTHDLSQRWLTKKTYYHLELAGSRTDNIEQRIEADVDAFTRVTFTLSLSLLRNIVNLATFIVVLWRLSGPIDFTIAGFSFHIPAYMVWVAVLYAMAGTLITFLLGTPLVKANFDQQRFGADFRFRLIHLRENAESIALYGGEEREQKGLAAAFKKIWFNQWLVMRLTKRLNWFTTIYDQVTVIFPYLVAGPRYFAGLIDFGTIFQVANAFGRVQDSLSWFVSFFQSLASWKATTDRLMTFVDAMETIETRLAGSRFSIVKTKSRGLKFEEGHVTSPNGRTLVNDVNLAIEPGEKVLISGPSGSGKTTLFRLFAGLWPFADGKLQLPSDAKMLFLSQVPYLPLGSLKEAIIFPGDPRYVSSDKVKATLLDLELGHLVNRLEEVANWSLVLSVGEQQRIAFARVLINRPDWIFLDEATSALDLANEQRVFSLLQKRLPESTIVSIAHRESTAHYHQRYLAIDPEQKTISMNVAPASAE